MSTFTQRNRFIAIETPLGADALGLISFTGHEELGRLFQFETELISDNARLNFDELIGQKASLRLDTKEAKPRYFHGYICRFTQMASRGKYARYHATIVPWLWLLTRRQDCRIYQDKTAPQIIEDVFKRSGVADYELKLTGTYSPRTYCVQYRETDFNFVSRLMEQEGLYYYFRHEKEKHTLVLVDSPSAQAPYAGYENISYRSTASNAHNSEFILDWVAGKELESGIYAHTDFNFENPSESLLTQSKIQRKHKFPNLEIFDYPGDFGKTADGDRHAKVRIQELQSRYELLQGEANSRGLCVGHTFALKEHPRSDQDRKYLIKSTHHSASAGEFETEAGAAEKAQAYHCTFSAFDAAEPFRLERRTPEPVVQGMQTAKVVGPSGETIHTDRFGRVKVRFHWDRHANGDDSSSCWIRASQPWGGGSWGGMFIPHVGQEVIVSFEEGDPDRPVITGRVYNADQMPPLELPANKSKSAIRDHGGNEIVMEGAAGSQQMKFHSPKHNTTMTLGNSFTLLTESDCKVKNEGCTEWETVGDSKWETLGDWRQNIVGNVDIKGGGDIASVFVGMKHDTVLISRSELTVGSKNESTLGMCSEVIGGAKIELHRGPRMESVPDIKEFIKGTLWQKRAEEKLIANERIELLGHLKQKVSDLESTVGALTQFVSKAFKLIAGKVDMESKADINLKASGDLNVKVSVADFRVKEVMVDGNLWVGGRAFSVKK